MRRSVAGAAASLALVAAGCDLRQPVGADGAAAPGLPRLDRAFDAGWTSEPLGGAPLAVPPDNGWNQFAWGGWRPTGIAVPESAWVHIRIEGGVDYRWNPDCAMIPPFWAGCGAHYEGETGTLSPWEGLGRVDVGLVSASGLIARLGDIEAVQPGADGGVRSFLAFSRVPTTVYTLRHMVYGGGVSPMDGYIGIPAYFLTSHQRITVEKVPTPLRVLAPARVQAEEVFQASLDVFPPFQLRPPHGSHHLEIIWEHVFVDEAEREIGSAPVHGCYRQPVCNVTVSRDGFLRVGTYVEMHWLVARSNLIRVGEEECPDGSMSALAASDADGAELPDGCAQPELALKCTGLDSADSIERGRTMSCTVRAEPSGTLSEIRWSFTASGTPPVTGPENSTTWGGTMVAGGRIQVEAKIDGDPVPPAELTISIQARRWPRLRLRVQEENPNHLPEPANVTAYSHLGDAHVDTVITVPETRIDTGPNAGWWYLDRPLGDVRLLVHINYPAFAGGSAWRKLQTPGKWTDPATGIQHDYCVSSQIPTVLNLTRRHEGSLPAAPGQVNHADAMRSYLNSNAPQVDLEAVVKHNADVTVSSTFERHVKEVYALAVVTPLLTVSQHKPDGLTDLAIFPCALRPWH